MKLLALLLLSFNPLTDGQLPGLTVNSQKEWPGQSLYGFMNGGSELFLEYGFLTMTEQNVTVSDKTFGIEYYLMETEEAAFGIYSVHCFKCQRADSLTLSECYIPTYMQFCHGKLYVTITCSDRSPATGELMNRLATAIMNNNPLTEEKKFPVERPASGKDYFVMGNLGLSAANISWCPFFEHFEHYSLWLNRDGDNVFSGKVRFLTAEDCKRFCEQDFSAFQNKSRIRVSQCSETECVIREINR